MSRLRRIVSGTARFMESHVEGVVVEVSGEFVKVRVKRHGECSSCGACEGDLGVLLDAHCPKAAVGDRVAIDLPSSLRLRSAFVIFLLPFFVAAAGWCLGGFLARISGVGVAWAPWAFCLAGVVASLLYIRSYDKLLAKRSEPPKAVRIDA